MVSFDCYNDVFDCGLIAVFIAKAHHRYQGFLGQDQPVIFPTFSIATNKCFEYFHSKDAKNLQIKKSSTGTKFKVRCSKVSSYLGIHLGRQP